MTEQEKRQLSRDVAEKLGIEESKVIIQAGVSLFYEVRVWLHDDSARCFDLMVEHEVGTKQLVNAKNGNAYSSEAFTYSKKHYCIDTSVCEHYTTHDNDKHLATRIAILKALLAKE